MMLGVQLGFRRQPPYGGDAGGVPPGGGGQLWFNDADASGLVAAVLLGV